MSESNLEDRAAIHDLFTRYCCALDNGSWPSQNGETPPGFPIHAADLPSRSYRTVARCRRSGMRLSESYLSIRAR
jgi:hypothetical protein